MSIVQERRSRTEVLRERLSKKTTIDHKTDCWNWQGAKLPTGYGHIKVDGREFYTHRLSYELAVGPIPAGLVIDHLCRNTSCLNPAHLEPVTTRENLLRSPVAPAAINAAKTHCKREHEFTTENTLVRSGGKRVCRTCKAAWDRNTQANRIARQGVSS